MFSRSCNIPGRMWAQNSPGRHQAPCVPEEPWRAVSFVQGRSSRQTDSLGPSLWGSDFVLPPALRTNTGMKTRAANKGCFLNLPPFGHSPLQFPSPAPRLFSGFGLFGSVSLFCSIYCILFYNDFSNYLKSTSNF